MSDKNNQIEISAIIPTYRRPKLLKNCIGSIINQSFPQDKYEIIVVGDNQYSITTEIVNYFRAVSNLRYLFHENRARLSAARNLGIKKARGEIIVFIDDDCIADRNWLSSIYDLCSKYPQVECVLGEINESIGSSPIMRMQQAARRLVNEKKIVEFGINNELSQALSFGGPNSAIKKNAILKYGLFYDEAIIGAEDRDLYRMIISAGLEVIYNRNMLITHFYRSDLKSFVKRYFGYGRGEYLLRKKWKDFIYRNIHILDFNPFKLARSYGIFWAIVIRTMILFRDVIWGCGFVYEKFKPAINNE